MPLQEIWALAVVHHCAWHRSSAQALVPSSSTRKPGVAQSSNCSQMVACGIRSEAPFGSPASGSCLRMQLEALHLSYPGNGMHSSPVPDSVTFHRPVCHQIGVPAVLKLLCCRVYGSENIIHCESKGSRDKMVLVIAI